MKPSFTFKNFVAGLAFAVAHNASAGLINFDTCLNNCENLGVSSGDEFTSVATLSFTDNMTGGVDFLLTNTVDKFDTSQTKAFLSELFLDFSSLPTGSEGATSNIDEILIDADAFELAGNLFDVKVDFANSGARRIERILANDTARWTLTGLTEQDILSQGVVLMQRLRTDQGSGASRILGSVGANPNAQSVPEPAMLGLFSIALLGAFGGRLRRRASVN